MVTLTRLKECWRKMHYRCNRLSIDTPAHNLCYIGVTVCTAWNDFEVFKTWALSNGYQDDLTLDRKENDKGYNPDNCEWSSKSQQSFNRRAFGKSKFRGVSVERNQWCARYTLKGKTVRIGIFITELEAALAYDNVVYKSGTGAKINFPERYKR